MDLIQMARSLGKALQQSEDYKKMQAAKDANDADQELQRQIEEFNMLRIQMSTAMQDETPDAEKTSELDTKLKALYTTIMGNQNMLAFNIAKQDIDKLMSEITTVLTASVNGEDPDTCEAERSSCGGGCSSCSGCH